MDREKLLMSQGQLQRWHVIGLVEGGKITLKEATKKKGVSYRQAKRIRRALRIKGVKGTTHGNTGRAPWNRTTDSICHKVLEFSSEIKIKMSPCCGSSVLQLARHCSTATHFYWNFLITYPKVIYKQPALIISVTLS
jgi:hypothetical protein